MSAIFKGNYHLVGGRRRHNACRRFRATRRRVVVARLLRLLGLHHGVQREIAERLGVSRSMVCRDIDLLTGTFRDATYTARRRAEETAARRSRHRSETPSEPVGSQQLGVAWDTIRRLPRHE